MFIAFLQNHLLYCLLAVCVTLTVSCCVCIYFLIKKKSADKNANNLKLLLHHLPFPWCCWYEDEDKVMVSKNFLNLFGINSGNVTALQDINRLFGPSPSSQFQRALSHICNYGGDFSLNLTLEHHQERELVITGSTVDIAQYNKQLFKNALPAKKLIILCVQDISATSSDIKKQHLQLTKAEEE